MQSPRATVHKWKGWQALAVVILPHCKEGYSWEGRPVPIASTVWSAEAARRNGSRPTTTPRRTRNVSDWLEAASPHYTQSAAVVFYYLYNDQQVT